ncbi:hypothetical protein Q0601_19120 [Paracoccus onubensis]|uniref:hypothetical protein n=1 Tax=Paracoccus onubensis TaxID=1675788 RepID=UPI00272F0ABE|nr:hypothetical protein [Paracoccus onubensis]MDP0929301.1 hypothetical protein [Paracoccus onubensis]
MEEATRHIADIRRTDRRNNPPVDKTARIPGMQHSKPAQFDFTWEETFGREQKILHNLR